MRTVLLLILFVFGMIHQAEAQRLEGRVPRIGFLRPGSASGSPATRAAFQQGLRDLGYIEGRNIIVRF
jgi:hypothetical protein